MLPFLRTDVTAVCLYENLILAGVGGSVCIYNKSTSAFLNKSKVLTGQKVHGFRPKANGTIAVHGGKHICIICVGKGADDADVDVTSVGEIECDDWILHTLWVEENTIALLTAHSVVQVWSASDGSWKQRERYTSRNNSILYSGLLEPLIDDLLVFAGTVFSEVIIQRCQSPEPLQTLEGHKGVIFSVAWDAVKEIIVTTSDDRSVRIWGPNTNTKYSTQHKEYWEHCNMVCKSAVYGHLSRVMKSTITESMIVSVGEDSHICFWDLSGKLLRKIKAHQNGCIWSVDSDSSHLVTGGSDAGVVLHPLTMAERNFQNGVFHTDEKLGAPKRIMFTARGNIAAYFATDELQYFDIESKHWQAVASYENTYKMIALSSCKQMLAVINVNGILDVFLENCKNALEMRKFASKSMDMGRICSLHWAGNRHLVICSKDGNVTVVASGCETLCSFHLPACKERWLTAAAVSPTQHMFALGDRSGNVHFYHSEGKSPMKTFRKVHGPYGPTSITWKDRAVVTTGRDGTIKYFSIKKCGSEVKMMQKVNLPFEWVELFIGGSDNLVCGFNERNFIVHNVRDGRSTIDVVCGGGHRAWDVRRYFQKVDNVFKEFIQFTYVKDSSINEATFEMDKISSKTIVSGSHVKEVNCLKMLPLENNISNAGVLKEIFFIAGGEDTTIRISSCYPDWSDRLIFKQLSSTRSVAVQLLGSNEMLLVSGGGRANICVKVINFIKCDANQFISLEAENIVEYQVKGSDKERKGNTSWRSDVEVDPETRIMSLELVEANKNTFIILAGCSDSILRIFKYCHGQDTIFKPFGQINYHKTCILIVHQCQLHGHKLHFTATTTGEVTVWDLGILIKEACENIDKDILDLSEAKPILKLKVNRSGINSLALSRAGGDLLLATGGDDNTIHLILLRLKERDNLSSIFELSRWSTSLWHNAQVTGLKFSDDYLISASIDQRITVSRCFAHDGTVVCQYIDQLYTDVADVQGLEVSSRDGDTITICVYGKGIETMNYTIPQ